MIKAIVRRWNRPKFPVYRQRGGYRAWKDKKPPRQDTWMRFVSFGLMLLVLAGVPCGGIGWYSQQRVNERDARIAAATAQAVSYQPTPEVTAETTAESTPELAPGRLLISTATLTPIPLRVLITETSPVGTGTVTLNSARDLQTATLTPIPLRTRAATNESPLLPTFHALLTGSPVVPTARAFPTLPLAQPSTPRPVVITPANNGGDPIEVVITAPPVIVVETVIVNEPPIVVVETVIVYPTPTETIPPEVTEETTDEPTATPSPTPTASHTPTWTLSPTPSATPTPTLTTES